MRERETMRKREKCTFLLQCHREKRMGGHTTTKVQRKYGFSMSTHRDISSLFSSNIGILQPAAHIHSPRHTALYLHFKFTYKTRVQTGPWSRVTHIPHVFWLLFVHKRSLACLDIHLQYISHKSLLIPQLPKGIWQNPLCIYPSGAQFICKVAKRFSQQCVCPPHIELSSH